MADVAMQLEPRIRKGRLAPSRSSSERLEEAVGTPAAAGEITFFYWAQTHDETSAEQRVAELVRLPSFSQKANRNRTTRTLIYRLKCFAYCCPPSASLCVAFVSQITQRRAQGCRDAIRRNQMLLEGRLKEAVSNGELPWRGACYLRVSLAPRRGGAFAFRMCALGLE